MHDSDSSPPEAVKAVAREDEAKAVAEKEEVAAERVAEGFTSPSPPGGRKEGFPSFPHI